MSVTSKPFLKETRNLSDKNCVLEMMKNIVLFLNTVGFPELVSLKEIQKIDKQSFVKYFNVIYFSILLCFYIFIKILSHYFAYYRVFTN